MPKLFSRVGLPHPPNKAFGIFSSTIRTAALIHWTSLSPFIIKLLSLFFFLFFGSPRFFLSAERHHKDWFPFYFRDASPTAWPFPIFVCRRTTPTPPPPPPPPLPFVDPSKSRSRVFRDELPPPVLKFRCFDTPER